ncbi:MAG: histidine kinase [Clostridia bacterium]|nr:histidine kinase [Clostridia bacterium]
MRTLNKPKLFSIKSGLLMFSLVPTFVLVVVIALTLSYNQWHKALAQAEEKFSKAVSEIDSALDQAVNFSVKTVTNSYLIDLFEQEDDGMSSNYETFRILSMSLSNYHDLNSTGFSKFAIFHDNHSIYRSTFSGYIDDLDPEFAEYLKKHGAQDMIWDEDDDYIYFYKNAQAKNHTVLTRYTIDKRIINDSIEKFNVLSNERSGFKNTVSFRYMTDTGENCFEKQLLNGRFMYLTVPWELKAYIYSINFGIFMVAYLLIAALFILFSNIFADKFKKRLTGFVDKLSDNKTLDPSLSLPFENDSVLTPIYSKIANLVSEINELNRENAEITQEKNLIELKYVQSQFNPHLLYNSLSVLKWECEKYDKSLAKAIDSMADYYRACISEYNEIVTLEGEIELVKKYLSLVGFVHKRVYPLIVRIDPELMNMQIPKHILQPFVENSVLHGIQQKMEGYIKITGNVEDGYTVLRIIDNGAGIPPERIKEIKESNYFSKYKSYGIKNTFERIRLFYGEDSELLIESNEGTQITIKFKAK